MTKKSKKGSTQPVQITRKEFDKILNSEKLTTENVTKFLGVSKSTMMNWRCEGIGRTVFYKIGTGKACRAFSLKEDKDIINCKNLHRFRPQSYSEIEKIIHDLLQCFNLEDKNENKAATLLLERWDDFKRNLL